MSILKMSGISKSFGPVNVLKNVDLEIETGEVLALLGENGAGKSTLMKILTGVYHADQGQIEIDNQIVSVQNISDSRSHGIEIIHQELNLFENLSIAENFLIGREDNYRNSFGLIDYKRLRSDTAEALKRVKLKRSPIEKVSGLSVGEQQLIEIAKALQSNIKFLVMDEPTAALTETETERLFELIEDLRQNDVGIVYISHRMEELYKIADKVEILRDGELIGTRKITEVKERELIQMMVGRDVEDRYPKAPAKIGKEILKVTHLTTKQVHDVNLNIKAGEIIGLGGLMGSGRTEVARAIAGIDKIKSGTVIFKGNECKFKNPSEAIQAGMAFVTEDRKGQGLILSFTVRENLSLPTLDRRSVLGWVNKKEEKKFAQEYIRNLRVKTSSEEQTAGSLSGGNQQKVVIGKWLASDPDLLILDEPTRGVDVGAKQEIYQLMNQLVSQGKGILMISSDLPELLGMCDRVYVMYHGSTQGEVKDNYLNEEDFMTLATGGALK
ncbi:sugar ABC transporter ATP-binding protein [Pullulanibacillus sp. KACC 23026]|uniref:sugar ABC transporter ATP-binding protein n=1 Tax=Pullulanibacillus sp. KACC 23026 TaxID=3028315 RepID=UPI0023AFC37A|nr:sugar ABC transporter ATP-binding protein [Pullulanibacillus sp. KACC 23026]WEG14883.1 sugar ABC transporter ATP-binding protein [Pullulanibacillus sp. KACC 23026]